MRAKVALPVRLAQLVAHLDTRAKVAAQPARLAQRVARLGMRAGVALDTILGSARRTAIDELGAKALVMTLGRGRIEAGVGQFLESLFAGEQESEHNPIIQIRRGRAERPERTMNSPIGFLRGTGSALLNFYYPTVA